jgi:uncharacterized protein
MKFDWDKNKAEANVQKHGVTFEQAVSVFKDPFAIIWPDNDSSPSEERWIQLGVSDDRKLLMVWYTERGDCIRIIGCRKATKTERRNYEDESDS